MDLFTGPIFCEILHEILSSDVEYLETSNVSVPVQLKSFGIIQNFVILFGLLPPLKELQVHH